VIPLTVMLAVIVAVRLPPLWSLRVNEAELAAAF
jgi:hypothetical protein